MGDRDLVTVAPLRCHAVDFAQRRCQCLPSRAVSHEAADRALMLCEDHYRAFIDYADEHITLRPLFDAADVGCAYEQLRKVHG